MPLAVDLSELPTDVLTKMHKALTDEFAAQLVQAKIRQQRIAKFYADHKPNAIEGVGGLNMAVDPFWIGYFNMLHGRQVWMDPDFPTWVNKQEDWFKVKSGGTRLQVGYGTCGQRAKFHKTYGTDHS
jgi:hypothetical protein